MKIPEKTQNKKAMLLLSLILLFTTKTLVFSQNVVPNPRFEEFITCPTSVTGLFNIVKNWNDASTPEPHFFHKCHDTLSGSIHYAGVPNNVRGIQANAHGAYIDIITLYGSSSDRAYATVRIPALTPGAIYRVSMRVSLADNSMWATYAPAIFFSVGADSFFATRNCLPFTPQVNFDYAGHIADKTNWITLSDTMVADSAYIRLFIGNFRDNAHTTKTDTPGGAIYPNMYACYYVDSVAVEKIANSAGVNNVNGLESLTIYPNPSNGSFTIALPGAEEAQIVVTDLAGRVVKGLSAIGKTEVILDVPTGVYFVTAYTRNGVLRERVVLK